jgi:class 3 adenylate cyclase
MVTDIAGFTAIVERLGDLEARLLIRAHNRLLRECLRQWRGAEITHTGDGLLVAFRSVGNALACAIEMQRRVVDYSSSLELPLRVRIGVHVGEPLPEDGRLFGACINTTVRVCAATEAERIMVSELACALAAGRALPFVFHGAVVLKGVADPISLHELLWREAPDSRAS